MRIPRSIRIVLAALVTSIGAIAPVAAQESVKIGVLTIRSGPASPVGDDLVAGIETAARMYGPVLGRPVELVIEDSLWNPQQAVSKATKLVQQNKVAAILGTSTIETLALSPMADRLNVPIITSNSGGSAITRANCSKWIFRTNPDDHMSLAALKHLIDQNPKLKNAKWFVMGHDYPYARIVTGSVKGVAGANYVGETYAPMDTTDWAPFIARARASGATAVMMAVTLGTPFLQFAQQAYDFGLMKDVAFVAPLGLPDWLVAKLGPLSTNIISAGSWGAWRYEDQEPVTKAFNEQFHKMHGRVAGMQSVQVGSAAMMLFTAITKAGSTDPDAVVRALETVDVRTPIGPLKFQPGGRQALSPLFLGPYEEVKPPKYGAQYAQRVVEAFPAAKSLPESAEQTGCKLAK